MKMNRHSAAARAGVVAAFALMLSGCGPSLPTAVGVLEPQLDETYGGAPKPVQPELRPAGASLQPGPPPINFPLFSDLGGSAGNEFPSFIIPPTRPVCPTASPFAAPLQSAPEDTVGVPYPLHPGYAFRSTGSVQHGTASAIPLKADSLVRAFDDVKQTDPAGGTVVTSYFYRVTQVGADGTKLITTFYPRANETTTGTNPGGLYIRSIETDVPGQPAYVFQPNPPNGIRIMNIPAAPESAATSETGTDPLTGTSMSISHQTLPRPTFENGELRADACGKLVDSWDVKVSGLIRSASPPPNQPYTVLKLDAVYGVATQMGAMIVASDVSYQAMDPTDPNGATPATGGQAYSQHSVDIINAVPDLPCDPATISYAADGTASSTSPGFHCSTPPQ
jgi:hypothetical protein